MRQTQFVVPDNSLRSIVVALFAVFAQSAGAENKNSLGEITIISTTPLPGTNNFVQEIAAPVKTFNAKKIQDSQSLDLSDFLNKNVGGVHINELQGNPLQNDVNYRGFTASPLLGTPQGISVYVDGVRQNQPFGDVVSWDLIPKSALASVTLIPGSNPLFGLNTLGGALSLTTKDGKSFPGTLIRETLGSNARFVTEYEHGGSNAKGWDWYVLGNRFQENGWRDKSPSRQNQLFSKIGYAWNGTELKLSAAVANNKLIGNGLQETTMLAQRYESVYTTPDQTNNGSFMLNLQGKHRMSNNMVATGNVYYRQLGTRTLNGDISDEALGSPDVYGSGQTPGNTPFPNSECTANPSQDSCNGLINRSRTRQKNMGISGQVTHIKDIGNNSNQFTLGAAFDQSNTSFIQSSEFGFINPNRSIQGTGVFNADEGPVNLDGKTRTYSAYATDTYSINNRWHLTASGRFNTTRVQNFDRLNPAGNGVPMDETLNGDYTYNKLNPAVGVTFVPSNRLNWYAGLNQGSRTPTSIELGCANPNAPCRLPNSLAGDPYLSQVVTRTAELGMRSKPTQTSELNIEVFKAENFDDILFVSSPVNTNFGYFKNFGQTRRQGGSIELGQRFKDVRVSMNYNYLDATYQSDDTFVATSNSSAQDSVIQVKKGSRIPLIPRHILKMGAEWSMTPRWTSTVNAVAIGDSLARGNENGQHQADGNNYLSGGKSAGYVFVNLNSRYQINPQLSVFGGINNVFDRRYTTAAQLGPQGFANGAYAGDSTAKFSTFYAPGAPRSLSIGLQYQFDMPVKRSE